MVSPLGGDALASWPRFLAGDFGGLRERDDLSAGNTLLVGDYRGDLPSVPASLGRFDCRNNAFALQALDGMREAWQGVLPGIPAERIGVVMGTSTSGVSDAEAAVAAHQATRAFTPSFHYAQLEFGGLAGFVAATVGARGPAYTLSTACSSGARALASGRSLLRLGLCDAVIAGAADTLCGLTAGGFTALHAVDPARTNPMSVNRRGLNLGEAAAVFLLTPDRGGVQLLGVGESSEAHHMSAPDPEGEGAAAAMRGALRDAGARAEDVLYLNLHGTGTEQNDAMESAAVARVFGTALPCSSTKPLIGHTLGAAGAVEAALCWLMLTESPPDALALPPHCFDGERDPALPEIHLATKGQRVARRGRSLVMTNSFGFGGNNCTLLLGHDAAGADGAGGAV